MIIDFHTHTFPKSIAKKALEVLGSNEGLTPFTDGTNEGLIESMDRSGVDVSILMPVVTKVQQTEDINRAAKSVEADTKGRLISFGGMHPEDEDYAVHLKQLKDAGVRGIKLHPVFQRTDFDNIRYKRIVDKASELGLITMVHAGYDISMPDAKYASAPRLISVVKEVQPEKLILAHMGSWKYWDEAETVIRECPNVWIDTAFVLPMNDGEYFFDTGIAALKPERFVKMVRNIGVDRVLFGTDSPWTDQLQSIESIRKSGLTNEEVDKILGKNAVRLLNF